MAYSMQKVMMKLMRNQTMMMMMMEAPKRKGREEEEGRRRSSEDEDEPPSPEVTIDGIEYGLKSEVTEIRVREGVTTIPDKAFLDCNNLTTVSLPSTLLSIGCYAFANCSSLPLLDTPHSVAFIRECVFVTVAIWSLSPFRRG